MNKSKYAVALVGLVASTLASAGTTVGVGVGTVVGAVVGTVLGTSIAEATGLPIEAVGHSAVFAIAGTALVVGIRIVRRKQRR